MVHVILQMDQSENLNTCTIPELRLVGSTNEYA